MPAEGNGIKIYRPAIAGDPGAFDAASDNYELVDKDYVDSRKTGLLSHIDFEVATGLGARQRMKLGTSHALWECDPNSNDRCNLAANFQGEHRYVPLPRLFPPPQLCSSLRHTPHRSSIPPIKLLLRNGICPPRRDGNGRQGQPGDARAQ